MRTREPGSIFGLVLLVALIALTIGTCSIHYANKVDEAISTLIQRSQDPTARLYDIPFTLPVGW